MKVSLNWLREYIKLDLSVDEIAEKFNLQVCEIESISKLAEGSNLVVGHVIERVMHPNSDHLSVCKVDVGSEVLQIVCGAPNVDVNQKVIVALIGAKLPGDFVIKKSKIRDVESFGMICSLDELGVDTKQLFTDLEDGIYVLNDDAKIGANPLDLLNLDDVIFELGLTPNRADLLSMIGVAHDLGAMINQKVSLPKFSVEEIADKNPVKVTLESDRVVQYHARYLSGIKVEESPLWLKLRLVAAGIKPINNVVDVTNYVLIEYGQPLHAFDADLLGNEIVVKNVSGEVVTLDDQKRVLEDDLVITGNNEVACIAGVMGSKSTQVSNETKNVILEAAEFLGSSVRKTSNRLQLRSESSLRFQRNIDSNRVIEALDKAAYLLTLLASAKVFKGIVSAYNPSSVSLVSFSIDEINRLTGKNYTSDDLLKILNKLSLEFNFTSKNSIYGLLNLIEVSLTKTNLLEVYDEQSDLGIVFNFIKNKSLIQLVTNTKKTNKFLGTSLTDLQLSEILDQLGFEYKVINRNFYVTIPSRRIDYDKNVQDLYEDIARVYGYNNIETTVCKTEHKGTLSFELEKIREIKNFFVNHGFHENINYSLMKDEEVHEFTLEEDELLSVMNPFTLEHKTFRQSLVTSLLNTLSYNLARKNDNLHSFEISSVFSKNKERKLLSAASTGVINSSLWQGKKETVDFFYLKGLLENLFSLLGVSAEYQACELKNLHPYQTANIIVRNKVIGFIGMVHPKYQKNHDLSETFIFEIDLELLLEATKTKINYSPISKFPSIKRDLAIVCKKDIIAGEITKLITQTVKKNLVNVELFDVYTGAGIEEDEKSLGYKLTFMSTEKTMESTDIDKACEQILKRLEFTYQAKLRA